MKPYTRQELEQKRREWQAQLDYLNGTKIARVAASLHPYRPRPVDGASDSTKPQEFAAPGASTTLNSGGSLGGCTPHGTD